MIFLHHIWNAFNFKVIRHIRKVGPETRDFWWVLRLETHLRGGTRDPEIGFSVNFLSFFWSLALMNEFMRIMRWCLFCVSYYPIIKHIHFYSFIILMSCSFPSQFLQKLPPCNCYEIFKFPTKPVIIVRSHIKSSRKYLNRRK